jgi:RecJ-like exonuclease
MSADPFIRTPAVYTDIGRITSESAGRRVRIIGFVVDTQDQTSFTLSDETGRISVVAEQSPPLQSFVRIFGTIAVSQEGQPLLRAEIIQDLTELDKQLFKRVWKIVQAAPRGRSS